MLKKITIIVVMVLLCAMVGAGMVKKQGYVHKNTTYIGVIGTYNSYDSVAEFEVQKINVYPYIYLNGTVTKDSNIYNVSLKVSPVPPSVPARPALMHGVCDELVVDGAVYFEGDNMCHIYGSFACGNISGWFSGDLQ